MAKLRENLRDLIDCGLPTALEVMGERWSFMILRASYNGLQHFEEFMSELGIARNILSNRLTRLVEHGILRREPCSSDRRKIEYRLTEKGLDLLGGRLCLRRPLWQEAPVAQAVPGTAGTGRHGTQPPCPHVAPADVAGAAQFAVDEPGAVDQVQDTQDHLADRLPG